ncbi:MAG: hypothetical protein A3A98_04285 [Candidatus Staskawiczbacteria bacterium RIFCSPLOWO2_01_FULL_40_39]|uniref:Thioredoxin domain-containing protein n=1 Tax=Candidatus Staskawiczbacteria bacterium RIFCSPHIGHO2_01_FULL_39_25 TaxID=1802202 RepID=A0A1G2HP47_9BACT|nr:MAG: hypothetical protein A2730_03500 [Candidatus Staskawiczbacteria bacterium RIFCSPHIGHO2_01_FULL_39_25]OGZ73986.1 MAG: hypothetical protein A3A98_04285 [Candidatus Staskawiczbacteria bacterium RIFCSPLOWO2_01_FULL_40_39]OGZ76428.1 MAG: hypothetical protein A3I87_02340 [Candidatus Staskawiczbacteria bacterium RIFCSPLOWO2_02_FULL_39_8]
MRKIKSIIKKFKNVPFKSPAIALTALIFTVLILIMLGYSFKGFTDIFFSQFSHQESKYKDTIVLFYGSGCEHCIKVDNFISANKIKEKVIFVELEVFNDANNVNLLADKAQICGLDSSHMGVPFLWDGPNQKCIVGEVDVIEFFRGKITAKY